MALVGVVMEGQSCEIRAQAGATSFTEVGSVGVCVDVDDSDSEFLWVSVRYLGGGDTLVWVRVCREDFRRVAEIFGGAVAAGGK